MTKQQRVIIAFVSAFLIVSPNLVYSKNTDNNNGGGNGNSKTEFAGLRFGVGISLTMDIGKNDRIESASVDNNGNVRVEKINNDVPRIMLESHYFFTPNTNLLNLNAKQWGWGPFVALQPGTDEIIEAIGMGLMLGLKRNDDENDSSSWNIGLGMVVDPSVKTLGDDIKENEPLPSGEDQIRYKETSQWGILVLTSFSF